MYLFISGLLSANIPELLGEELYTVVCAIVVCAWAILPMVGIVLAFCTVLDGMFRGGRG